MAEDASRHHTHGDRRAIILSMVDRSGVRSSRTQMPAIPQMPSQAQKPQIGATD